MRVYAVGVVCLISALGCGRTAPFDDVQQPTAYVSCATPHFSAIGPASMFEVPLPPGVANLPMPGNAAPVRESALLRDTISAALDHVSRLTFATPPTMAGPGVYEWRGAARAESFTWRLRVTPTTPIPQDPCSELDAGWAFQLEARPVMAIDPAPWTLVAQGERAIPGGEYQHGTGWISVDWNAACGEINADVCTAPIGLSTVWVAYSRSKEGIQVDAKAVNRNHSQWGLSSESIDIHSMVDAAGMGLLKVTKTENISWSTDSWNNQAFPYTLRWTADGAGRGDFHYLRFLAYPTWEPTLTVRCWNTALTLVYHAQTGYPSTGDPRLCAFQ